MMNQFSSIKYNEEMHIDIDRFCDMHVRKPQVYYFSVACDILHKNCSIKSERVLAKLVMGKKDPKKLVWAG